MEEILTFYQLGTIDIEEVNDCHSTFFFLIGQCLQLFFWVFLVMCDISSFNSDMMCGLGFSSE